ncbi:MAG TPA: DUF4142 domain-containing protein [Blastococcus sp.]
MHDRPSGPPLSATLLSGSRLGSRWPRLLGATVLVLAASTSALIVPAGTAAAADYFPLDAVETATHASLAQQGSGTATGIGAPTQVDVENAAAAREPVGPADRDLLHRVKQAGLWEMPVGMMAGARAANPRLREVGAKIAAEHQALDGLVNRAAATLAEALPDRPTDEQQAWMGEINAVGGDTFDQRTVFLLRQAHGKVLPILAEVRAGTRNAVIRQFATEATAFVQRHIEYLESTGLVAFDQLPEPPGPGQQSAQASSSGTQNWWRHPVDAGVLAVLIPLVAALMFLIGRKVAGLRSRAVKTPRRKARGQHAWSSR